MWNDHQMMSQMTAIFVNFNWVLFQQIFYAGNYVMDATGDFLKRQDMADYSNFPEGQFSA